MCGICGIASTRARRPRPARGDEPSTCCRRGAETQDGAYLDGRVGLAARRLAIIDLATGDQPISNRGRPDHGRSERRTLQLPRVRLELERAGHRFSTSGDTEVLVHLYEEHGERFAERLRGMFAMALWDSERGRLRARARPVRIKPLYYREPGSEMSSHPSCERFHAARPGGAHRPERRAGTDSRSDLSTGYVGILTVELHFPEAGSLKGKRKYVKSAKAQLQNRFGASVAEVDHHEKWQRARLTVACVDPRAPRGGAPARRGGAVSQRAGVRARVRGERRWWRPDD